MDCRHVTVETRIKSPEELLKAMLAVDTLVASGYIVQLDIRYLMGARMDRRLSPQQPFTLDVVAKALQTVTRNTTRILDPHSSVATTLLGAETVLPLGAVRNVLATLGDVEVIIPDKGATARVETLAGYYLEQRRKPAIQCLKGRNVQTGEILGVTCLDIDRVKGKRCLIIDDICDGGATFISLARLLRGGGATAVYLYVTHGIFSKTLPLEGIDTIYTTDSYHHWVFGAPSVVCIPLRMRDL